MGATDIEQAASALSYSDQRRHQRRLEARKFQHRPLIRRPGPGITHCRVKVDAFAGPQNLLELRDHVPLQVRELGETNKRLRRAAQQTRASERRQFVARAVR
jgi:hypothetical protein